MSDESDVVGDRVFDRRGKLGNEGQSSDAAAHLLRRSTDQMKSSNNMLWNMFGIMVCFWFVVMVTGTIAYFMGRASATAEVKVEPNINIPSLDLGDLPKPQQPIFYVISSKNDKPVTVNENFTFPDVVRVKLEEPKATTVDPPVTKPAPVKKPATKPAPVKKPAIKPAPKPEPKKKETKLDKSKIRILPPPKGIPKQSEIHATAVWNEAERMYAKQKWEEAQNMYLYFKDDHNKSRIYQDKKDVLILRLKDISQKLK